MNILAQILENDFSVLIVDDSKVSCSILRDSLTQYIKDVDLASNGIEAIALMKNKKYDFIITDIEMPKMNGIELTQKIRRTNQNLPIIAVSSLSDTDKLIDLLNAGVTGFITKPFDMNLIKSQLFRIIHPILSNLETIKNKKALEDRLESVFKFSRDGIAILDKDTNFIMSNSAYMDMLGFDEKELKEQSCMGLTIAEDVQKAKDAIAEVEKKGFIEDFQKRCHTKNKDIIEVSLNISLIPNKEHFLITARDITATNELQFNLNNYISLVDKSIITSSTDLKGNILSVSDAFCKISKYSKEELIGQPHSIVRHPDFPKKVYEELWATIEDDKTWKGEIKNLAKDGSTYWVLAEISPVFDRYNNKIGYMAVRQDITDKKTIETLLITDSLTNIYNRRYFTEHFPRILNDAKRDDKLIAFLIFDVDHFKQYNDNYGHQMGDKVLQGIGSGVSEVLHRSNDYFFRLGGEEFGVVFIPESKEKALAFSQKIRQAVVDLNIEHKYNSAADCITASFGLECLEANKVNSVDEMYKNADEKLYRAKELGRNNVVHKFEDITYSI